MRKSPKPFYAKNHKKKYAVKLNLFFQDLQHYAAKLIFHIFQKKKWPRFSKMDIFKMSIFGKSQHKFIQHFWWELYLWEHHSIFTGLGHENPL